MGLKPSWIALALVSAVGIAYQIVLMRVFAVAQWHHFAYMIISIAMLGFGAAGSLLAALRPRLRGRESSWLFLCALLLTLSLPGCYALSQAIPFETLQLAHRRIQWLYLFTLYLVLSLPFFLVSACIALMFLREPGRVARLYFYDLTGSGLGAAAAVGLLYAAPPAALPYVLAVPAALACLLLATGRIRRATGALLLAAVAVAAASGRYVPVRVSEYKALSYARLYPDALVLTERYSPLSTLTVVKSDLIRETPGQIGNYPMSEYGALPEQIGLFFDAGAISPVSAFDGSLRPFTFLDYVTSALPYRLVDRPRVLVIGAGGGMEVLNALVHEAAHVTALEVDPHVPDLVNGLLGEFSGGLYRRPDVTPVLAEGRGFLASNDDEYDLIQLPMFGSLGAGGAGVYALNESYLYTVEAFQLCLSRLSERGVFSANCWVRAPAGEAIKLFATAVAACEARGYEDPGRHIAFIRSWNNATLVISRAPLTDAQVEEIRTFCDDRGFDLCNLPGIRADEVNRFTFLERPIHYEAAQAILSPGREGFYRDYIQYVRPPRDNRPYFFRFFKWSTLPRLLESAGPDWVNFIEWGYITIVATVVQSLIAGAVLILLPLVVWARSPGKRGGKGRVFAYFAALGLSFMFLEIALIQRFMLFLAYPVYAVTVVLAALLLFSGLGSLYAASASGPPAPRVRRAVIGIAVVSLLYMLLLPGLYRFGGGWPDAVKIAASVFLLAPLAFCMGIPFPSALAVVARDRTDLLPWAWGINGCASVVGATLATLVAVHAGFPVVVGAAVLLYGLAAVAFPRSTAVLDADTP